jgi:PAS domain S-box-containing protein
VRTLVLLTIAGCCLIFASILLWSGTGIINVLIQQFGTEILTEKLNSIIQPVELRYTTLQRIGLEDSFNHRNEIRQDALKTFAGFRYKKTGSIFVISNAGDIILSSDFNQNNDSDFDTFIKGLKDRSGTLTFSIGKHKRYSVFRFYQPWDSYIGIAIDQNELFAYKYLFVKIVLMLLAAVLLGTILFSSFIQRLIISPLIRLSQFANQVSKGNYDMKLDGKYILELGALKVDIEQMVTTLRQKMDQTSAQLQLIRERERWLDEALGALQESEKKYRTIYNAPSDSILIYDPEQGKIVDANKGMLDMFGYHYEDLHDMSLGDLSSGEFPFTRAETEKMIAATLEQGTQLFEWMVRKKDGEVFWVEISLQSTYLEGKKQILAVMRNTHLRKMAQQDLASEKERLAVTLRCIGDGVITTDDRGRIVLMNKVAESLTGWRQHEAAGRLFPDVFHIIHQKTGERCDNPVDEVLASGETINLASDTVLIAKDGSRKVIADSGAPIRDPQSAVIGSVIVFRDVTEEKRMEEELFKVKKLESVGVLAGGIAHDFNNILVGILGNISLARQCLSDPEQADAMLLNTEKAAMRAKDLTAQLLTFSRGGEPVIQTASIGPIITESSEFALRGSNIKIIFNIPVDLWLVNADTGQIGQVIQNIVLNAKQAIPAEGTVEITCFNCADCGNGAESLRERCVRIMISDNGPGIPDEILGKIFDPYFTTKDDGSGLGLSICHSIIKKHNGAITVESKPGKGTVFTIQLPVSSNQKIAPQLELPRHSFSKRKAKVLVMDDDTMILELSKQMLEYLGHEVVICKEGESALKKYEKAMQEGCPFDVVIMDLTIPGGMGGEKAIRKLLKLDPEAKAIVSSGYSNDKVISNYMKHGFKTVIVKPYQIEDLDKAIQNTLGT